MGLGITLKTFVSPLQQLAPGGLHQVERFSTMAEKHRRVEIHTNAEHPEHRGRLCLTIYLKTRHFLRSFHGVSF
jgi:hypothetical protein